LKPLRIYTSEYGFHFIQLCEVPDESLRRAFKKWLQGQTIPQQGQAYAHDWEAFLNTLEWIKQYPDPLEREKAQKAFILDIVQKPDKDHE